MNYVFAVLVILGMATAIGWVIWTKKKERTIGELEAKAAEYYEKITKKGGE